MCIYIMQHNVRRQPTFAKQLVDVFLIELTNWRWSWRSLLIAGTLAPLLSMLALSVFARDSGRGSLAYVLTGNVVLALMFGNMDNIQNHFMFMRFQGTLDYFATLPIRKAAVILALVLAFFLISLPSQLVTIIVGTLVLKIPLVVNPLVIVVVPLCVIPLSGIGALIGTTARTPQEAGTISFLLTFLLVGVGPVVIPPDHLPQIMLILGRFSPATYAASALRQVLLGPVTGQLGIDLLVLAGVSVVVFWIVGKKLDWRRDE
jgi:ABC-2 type transport system permease protein